MEKTIGIIGGMGPLATCDMFYKILNAVDADSDQAFPRVVIDSNTEIPDRTKAILNGGKDPIPEMVRSAVRLESMGAEVLVISCNTAHYFYKNLQLFVHVPVLNMLAETARFLHENKIKKAALLATDGTVQSGVYKKAFDAEGIEMLLPSKEGQNSIMNLIYNGVKKDNFSISVGGVQREIKSLFDRGAETLVLGCTELPIAFSYYHFSDKITDPTEIIAISALKFIGCKVKNCQ